MSVNGVTIFFNTKAHLTNTRRTTSVIKMTVRALAQYVVIISKTNIFWLIIPENFTHSKSVMTVENQFQLPILRFSTTVKWVGQPEEKNVTP